ncbi:lymphocyte function-associated antigen 3-like [Chanodichthys erythropterus]|uniref:lymphocyte function-associated antigen 3-like n=1 Tax=Chanodichthys erythropterus TaxID=933992 RepID=UPI00351E19F2
MRSLWDVSNLFVCLILSNLNAVTSVVYVENGKSLTLNPNIQGTPEDILWTYNGNKVAEHDLTEFQDYGQFRRRSEIEISTGRLMVRHMTSHDSGIYKSVIQINGKLQNSENEVKVIDAVQEPNVTCKLNKLSRTLLCSVSSQFNVSYGWTGSGSAPQSGQELQISKEEKPDSVYTCTVKNEVSQKSSSFTVKDCDTDEPQSYQNIIISVATSVIIAVFVGIIVVAICFIQQRRGTGVYNIECLPQNLLINTSESPGTQEPKKEGHMSEEDKQETSEAQTLNGPAQDRCEEPSSRNTEIT